MVNDAQLPVWDEKNAEQKIDALKVLVDDLYKYQMERPLQIISDQLSRHKPADEVEEQHIQKIKHYMQTLPNIISRNCEKAHFVASAIIIDLSSGRILLHFHRKLGKWLQVGGHAIYETDFSLVAMREAEEETGLTDLKFFPDETTPLFIDVDVHAIPQTSTVPQHDHLDLRYLLSTEQPDRVFAKEAQVHRDKGESSKLRGKGESSRFEWLTFSEAKKHPLIVDNLIRFINKAERIYLDYENKSSGNLDSKQHEAKSDEQSEKVERTGSENAKDTD